MRDTINSRDMHGYLVMALHDIYDVTNDMARGLRYPLNLASSAALRGDAEPLNQEPLSNLTRLNHNANVISFHPHSFHLIHFHLIPRNFR